MNNSSLETARDITLKTLSETQIFDGFPTESLEQFYVKIFKTENLRNAGLYQNFFDYETDGRDLSLMVIMSGCLAVIAKNDKDVSSIDALLTPGQVIGDFEMLGFSSTGLKLQAISANTVLYSFEKEDIENLKPPQQLLFYKNLSKTLVSKLKTQANWIKIRNVSSVSERLGMLLEYFHTNPDWKRLTKSNERGYDVDVIWSLDRLSKCLSTSIQSLPAAIQDLLEHNLITVDEVKNLEKPDELTKFPKNFFTKTLQKTEGSRYIKISVSNKGKLSSFDFDILRKRKMTRTSTKKNKVSN